MADDYFVRLARSGDEGPGGARSALALIGAIIVALVVLAIIFLPVTIFLITCAFADTPCLS